MDLANTERSPVDIAAHDNSLFCMSLNLPGTRLATASEKVVRNHCTTKTKPSLPHYSSSYRAPGIVSPGQVHKSELIVFS